MSSVRLLSIVKWAGGCRAKKRRKSRKRNSFCLVQCFWSFSSVFCEYCDKSWIVSEPPFCQPLSLPFCFESKIRLHVFCPVKIWRFRISPPFCFCFDWPKLRHSTADLYQNSAHFVNKNPDFFIQIRTVWRSLFWVATTITTNWEGALFSAIQSNPVWFWHFLGHHIN